MKVAAKSMFYVEVTDTYGGEANYSWANRYKVQASTFRGALRKVRNHMCLPTAKLVMDCGDLVRYDFKGTCICAFVEYYHNQSEVMLNIKSI